MTARPLELTVFVDGDCPLCRRVADWLLRQPTFVTLHVRRAQSAAGTAACPLSLDQLLEKVTVTASDGAVYRGTKAWLVCLWALRNWRGFAMRLAGPRLLPWANRLFALVTGLAKKSKRAAPRAQQ